MPDLYDGNHLHADLRLIRAEWGEKQAIKIEAFLDELGSNDDAMWALMQRKQVRQFERPFFNSCAIEWMLEDGYNMYRLRPIRPMSEYRVLYAFDAEHEEFHVLAIVRKKPRTAPDYDQRKFYDYERDHRISIRVLDEYDDLGFPRIGQ
ncbi:hypothetical protein [Caballeronia sp. TF1N1]|uniref:hypothetical protein n=1 Tax=Caballeronia sp. TF1N1 TaxID=2878153 RepID=UPI001FD1DA10|nr:hypothetical protein [Caballeronia sp. TF1N1]